MADNAQTIPTIDEIRQKYPKQYGHIPDEVLAEKLHTKYGAGIPKDQFYEKIGFKGGNSGIMNLLKQKAIRAWNKPAGLIDPMRLVQAGLMGLGEGGQNIASTLTGGKAPRVDMPEMFGMKDQSTPERLVSGAAQYAPLMMTGGLGLIPDAAAGAAYTASQSPEDKTTGAEVGGGTSAAFNVLNKLMTSSSPALKMVARGLLGGGIGYETEGAPGAAAGSIVGAALPKVASKMGFAGDPSAEILKSIKPQEAMERARAGQRLGTPLTPGEASARPDVTAIEARIGKEGDAAAQRVKLGQDRINQQKAAIDKLYKTITPSNKIAAFDTRKAARDSIAKMEDARQEAVDPYYQEAYKKSVAPNLITSLEKSDANIANAIQDAMNDPKYQVEGELLNVPKNSIKTLDYAKRKIDAQITQAENFGDDDAVRVLTASKNKLLDKISGFSDDYKKARGIYSELSKPIDEVNNSEIGRMANMKDTSLKNISSNIFDPAQTDISVLRRIKDHVQKENPQAWDSIVKNEMNRLMTKKKGITGRSFFDTILANDNRFKQFQVALEHNPKALQQLNDMKTAWEHLINVETPRTAAGQSSSKVNMFRNSLDALVGAYNNLFGGEKQLKALNYIYSDKWIKDLGKVQKLPPKQRKSMMPILLGKSIAPSYMIDNKDGEK